MQAPPLEQHEQSSASREARTALDKTNSPFDAQRMRQKTDLTSQTRPRYQSIQSLDLPGQYPQTAGIPGQFTQRVGIPSCGYPSQDYQSDFGFRTGNTFVNQTGPGQFPGERSLRMFAKAATDNRKDARPTHSYQENNVDQVYRDQAFPASKANWWLDRPRRDHRSSLKSFHRCTILTCVR